MESKSTENIYTYRILIVCMVSYIVNTIANLIDTLFYLQISLRGKAK